MFARTTRMYISAVVCLGATSIGLSVFRLHVTDWTMFATLGALAIFGSALKVRVPGVEGNVSLSFLPLLLSSVILSIEETILLTAAAALVQSVSLSMRRIRMVQASFNLSALTLSIAAATAGSHWLVDPRTPVLRLAIAGGLYYVCNSALVTTVIGLVHNKKVGEIWDDCMRLYLPYLFAGLFCAALAFSGMSGTEGKHQFQSSGIIMLSLMLLARHYLKVTATTSRRTA